VLLAGTARWWWIGDLCCHYRLQYTVLLCVLTTALAMRRQRPWAAILAIVLAVHLWMLLPLFWPGPSAPAPGARLKVLTVNVFVGNPDAGRLIDLVRQEQPDVLVLHEIDPAWMQRIESLRRDYPHSVSGMRDHGYAGFGPFGMAILSRIPLTSSELRPVGAKSLPVAMVRLTHAGQGWTIIAAHPYPPVTPSCFAIRNAYLQEVAELSASADGRRVVAGDLNTTRWSPIFAELLRTGGLRDSADGRGWQPTWPDWLPIRLLAIDHVLVSPDVAVLERRVGRAIGSDHRPVIVELAASPAL
jgi:endonuclease/exonuclease/phosphatase (EEP) superfamily protein YafD